MPFVGLLGILALLGLAWSMSFARRKVRWRPVVWGLGLQFLFAVIVLKENAWSFVGMAVLAGLVGTYLLIAGRERLAGGPGAVVGALAGAGAIAFALGRLAPAALPWLLLGLVVVLAANARWRVLTAVQPVLGTLLVAGGVALLATRGLHGQALFAVFSGKVAAFLALSDFGAAFLFGNLVDGRHFFPGPDAGWPGFGFQFAFKVLPTIIFFGGFMGVLYYLGLMQKVIEAMARFMRWTIGTSGAETLSCSANVFVGQTEAPLLIKPFLGGMTRSELLTVMVGGFATIAGGVLAGYIAMGIPATHLIAASVMAAPAALAVGKIVFPELEHSETAGDASMPDIPVGANVIEAAANGISDGLKLAINVAAMLIGFIALIAVVDVLLNWLDRLIDGFLLGGAWVAYNSGAMSPAVGEHVGVFPGSLQTLFGSALRPLAFLMGVPWSDAAQVGNLLGIKLSLNEFVAYGQLGAYIAQDSLSERATVIATYALCGFANFSSIGIQIGGISAVAPSRKSELALVGLKAMLGGAIVSCLSATIAGLLL